MAVVQGIREKVHAPLYDAIVVEPEKQLRDVIKNAATLRLFVDVQEKTKLHTNLQSASLLPHYNTFEARAMRVVISDLPPEFPDVEKQKEEDLDVTDGDKVVDKAGNIEGDTGFVAGDALSASIELGLGRWMELLNEARKSADKEAQVSLLDLSDEELTLDPDPTDRDRVDQVGVVPLSL